MLQYRQERPGGLTGPLDRHVEQAKLLAKYRVDTGEELAILIEAVQGEIDVLSNQRKRNRP